MRGLFVQDGPQQTPAAPAQGERFHGRYREGRYQPGFDPRIGTVFLKPSWTLEYALRTFDTGGHHALPVVDENDETKIIAWALQTHALRYFNAALIEASAEEHHH